MSIPNAFLQFPVTNYLIIKWILNKEEISCGIHSAG